MQEPRRPLAATTTTLPHLRALPQSRNDAELAVHGVRRRKHPARRLLAQHILLTACLHTLHASPCMVAECNDAHDRQMNKVHDTAVLCTHLYEVCWITLAMCKLVHGQLRVLGETGNVPHQVCMQRLLQCASTARLATNASDFERTISCASLHIRQVPNLIENVRRGWSDCQA
jgi:hypothetical protein